MEFDPPTQEEIDEFVVENRRWLSDEAEDILRHMDNQDQRHVIAEGSMSNCRDPVAIVKSRAWNGHLKAHREWMESRKDWSTEQLLQDFMEVNAKWMNDEAEEALRALDIDTLWGVIDFGSLANCRDPTAIIKIRSRDVRQGKAGKSGRGKSKGKPFGIGKANPNPERRTERRDSKSGKGGKGKDEDRWDGGKGRSGDRWDGGKGRDDDRWDGGKGRGGDRSDSGKGKGGDRWDGGKGRNGDAWGAEDGEDEGAEPKKEKKEPPPMPSKGINEAAVNEGRAMYCVGLPPLWSTRQIEEFFGHQGEVENVVLMNVQKGKNNRAAYINFKTSEGATDAALVCDRLDVEDRGETFMLQCSIKQKTGSRTYGHKFSFIARGEVDHRIAQQEGRTVFLSKLPLEIQAEQIEAVAEQHGEVESVHILPPNNISAAAFVTMVSPGEAAFMARALDNSWEFGKIIGASIAVEKNEKRKKPHPEDETIQWYPLEIRNFPHWTLPDDIKATITTVGPQSQRVRIMYYDPEPTLSVARAYFREESDRDQVLRGIAGFEFTPGYSLMAMPLPRTSGTGPGFAHHNTPQPQPPLTFGGSASSRPPAIANAPFSMQPTPRPTMGVNTHGPVPAAFQANPAAVRHALSLPGKVALRPGASQAALAAAAEAGLWAPH